MALRLLLAVLLLAMCAGCQVSGSGQSFHSADAPAPAAGTIFIYPERLPLKEGGFVQAERGVYFAPLNRSRAGSDVIGIEIYRFKASPEADPATPPVFFLHGGPSFQGLERSLERAGTYEERWLPLTRVSDVVVVGQRGIGSSKPTTTIGIVSQPQPADQPFDQEKAKAELQAELTREKSFWEEAGLDLSGFTVLEAAEDVNEVRQALGYEKIVLWGGSFGSHWSMSLMRLHPEIVERAILRGMEGPDHTYDHPGHLWKVYERVAAEAEASDELKGMIPEGGLIAALQAVIEKARTQPFRVTVSGSGGESQEVLFDGDSIRRLSRGYTLGLAGWPADVITLSRGDYERAAYRLLRRAAGSGRSIRTASYFMLDCGSGITAQRLAEYDSDPAAEILAPMNTGYVFGCPVWGSDLGDDFRQNFETEIPTVIVHGTWDTSTPYENAVELVPYFKNSKFITVKRGPHGAIQAAMRQSVPFREGIMHFAKTGDDSRLPDEVTMPPVRWSVPPAQ